MRTGIDERGLGAALAPRDLAALDGGRVHLLRLHLRWARADRVRPAPVRTGWRPVAGRGRSPRRVLWPLVAALVAVTVAPATVQAQDEADPTSTTTSSTSVPETTTSTTEPETTTTTAPDDSTTTTEPGPGSTTSTTLPDPEDPAKVIDAGKSGFDVLTADELELLQKYQDVLDRYTKAQQDLITINGQVIASQDDLLAAQSRVRSAESALAEVEDKLAAAQDELQGHEARLQEIAVSAYIGGGRGMGPWASVLKSETVDDLTKGRIYANAIADDQQVVIDRARQLRDQIGGLSRAAEDYKREQAQARDDRARHTAELEAQQKQYAQATQDAEAALRENEQVLAAINSEKGNFLARAAALQGQGGSIGDTLARREVGQSLPSLTAGMFHPPVRGYKLTSLFGYRVHPLYGSGAFHAGLDMALPQSEPIRAAEDGEVVIAGEVGGYGNTVVIDHGQGLGTLYGHALTLRVKVGDKVQRGQIIALVGTTGNSTGPHVHWEVREFGEPVNPMPFLGHDDGGP